MSRTCKRTTNGQGGRILNGDSGLTGSAPVHP